jgi:hypothetical protein
MRSVTARPLPPDEATAARLRSISSKMKATRPESARTSLMWNSRTRWRFSRATNAISTSP